MKKKKKTFKPVSVINFWSNSYIEYESNCDRNKTISVEKYLNKVGSYLKDIIDNLKKSDTSEIQSAIANNFVSSIDNDEERVIHSKSDNRKIMINDEAVEVIELSNSPKNRYQNDLESMKGIEFVFDYVHLLYYKYHKINLKRGRSYIDLS